MNKNGVKFFVARWGLKMTRAVLGEVTAGSVPSLVWIGFTLSLISSSEQLICIRARQGL